jgi:eukaryotic-like serine/threonine-protein kinase
MEEQTRDNEIIDDRYKIMETAGSGGMAIVYRAHDLISDKDVAIKMLKPETAANKINLSRFEREARTAASMNHQNIVRVLNVGSYQGLPYMVNEYVDGQNLRQVLDVRGKFSFMEACDIMYQLCSAIMYAHNHGVIHRDIKPQNIFLTSDGIIKLGDFGIATFENANHVTRQETFVGTVHYTSPEVSQGNPASTRSDIYSMGITFFELIAGRVPFDGDSVWAITNMKMSRDFPSLKKYNPKTPECIENIIYKACMRNPNDRYVNAEMMRKDIEKILKNPSLLEKKNSSFLYDFFHPNSRSAKQRREENMQKKALQKAARQAKKERGESER